MSIVARQSAASMGKPFDEEADAALRQHGRGPDRARVAGDVHERQGVRRRHHRPTRHPHRARHVPQRRSTTNRSRAHAATACSGCDATIRTRHPSTAARRQPRRDRAPHLPHLPPARRSTTVAVFSDADADAPFVREADARRAAARHRAADTYLRGDLLIAAALATAARRRSTPATASCPRTPPFAQAVARRRPRRGSARRRRRSRRWARRSRRSGSMRAPACRCAPDNTVESLDEIGLPALVKASAGGGGRGMRIVRDRRRAGRRHRVAPSARRWRRSATARCSSSATSRAPATSRSRSSPTRTATSSRSTSATARCSAATRRSRGEPRRPRSTASCASAWTLPPSPRHAPSATSAPAPSSSCSTATARSRSSR